MFSQLSATLLVLDLQQIVHLAQIEIDPQAEQRLGVVQFQIPLALPLRHRDQIQRVLEVVHVQEERDLVEPGEGRARPAQRHVRFQFGRVDAILGEGHEVAHVGIEADGAQGRELALAGE